jgi:hypothetical protein
MPLVTEVKAATNQVAPNPINNRVEVKMGTPAPTTARVEALKAKLTGQPTTQPVAPRPAGSTARAEQYAKLQNQSGIVNQPVQKTQPMQDVEPPPTQQVASTERAQINNNVEDTEQALEATEKPISPQFAALAKQERQLRKAQRDFKMQQQAWKTNEANFVSKDLLKTDPLKALSEAGISYEKLTELQLGQVAPDPNQSLINKIAELEAKLASVDEQFTKRDTQAYDAAVNQIRNDVKLLVDSDDTYETIRATGESETVVELIKKVFDAEGTILSVEEAAKLVEEKLLDRKLAEVERLSKLSKIKSRLSKPSETTAEATPTQQGQKQPTLSNQAAVSRPLTARERAIMAFESAKNKTT